MTPHYTPHFRPSLLCGYLLCEHFTDTSVHRYIPVRAPLRFDVSAHDGLDSFERLRPADPCYDQRYRTHAARAARCTVARTYLATRYYTAPPHLPPLPPPPGVALFRRSLAIVNPRPAIPLLPFFVRVPPSLKRPVLAAPGVWTTFVGLPPTSSPVCLTAHTLRSAHLPHTAHTTRPHSRSGWFVRCGQLDGSAFWTFWFRFDAVSLSSVLPVGYQTARGHCFMVDISRTRCLLQVHPKRALLHRRTMPVFSPRTLLQVHYPPHPHCTRAHTHTGVPHPTRSFNHAHILTTQLFVLVYEHSDRPPAFPTDDAYYPTADTTR